MSTRHHAFSILILCGTSCHAFACGALPEGLATSEVAILELPIRSLPTVEFSVGNFQLYASAEAMLEALSCYDTREVVPQIAEALRSQLPLKRRERLDLHELLSSLVPGWWAYAPGNRRRNFIAKGESALEDAFADLLDTSKAAIMRDGNLIETVHRRVVDVECGADYRIYFMPTGERVLSVGGGCIVF